ncbi:hypothetical protein GOODEAATRI_029982 [Goodea atripinnis]|uniref:Uncharacterized protein n=1 Tax=Goodea atripinnis TaxID=208336 RepID=A0ABV0N5C7_9TELE
MLICHHRRLKGGRSSVTLWIMFLMLILVARTQTQNVTTFGSTYGADKYRARCETPALQRSTDPCIEQYGGVELNYTLGSSVTFQFDLCDVIDCGDRYSAWRGYDIFMCHFRWGAPYGGQWCPRWSFVGWNTGPGGYTTPLSGELKQLQNIRLVQGKLTSPSIPESHMKVNPLLLTVENLKENVFYCSKYPLNNCQKRGDKGFYLILLWGLMFRARIVRGLIWS